VKFSNQKSNESPRLAGEFVDTPADKEFKAKALAKPVRDTEPAPARVTLKMYNELSEKVVQLAARLAKLEKAADPYLSTPIPEVVDESHPKTTNGHPITKAGIVASFIEVPSLEEVISAAKVFKEKHGAGDLAALVKSFDVSKLSELNDEQKALFLEQARGGSNV
jgi:hypothetical protein